MKPAGLFLVLLLAKIASLQGHHVAVSPWSLIAYFWQDALVVLIFAGIASLRRRALSVVTYWTLVIYIAVNIPVTRALATPLTWNMWRAAGGVLADSIWHYVTWPNVSWVLAVAGVSIVSPAAFRRLPLRPFVLALLLLVILGPFAARRVDTGGFDRNAWTAIATTTIPRLESSGAGATLEEIQFNRTRYENLTRLSGVAAGRNVVLVSLESTAAQYLGIYGAAPDVAPHLSELARSGVVFENAYASYPESIKGLFSVLCSTYPAFDIAAELYDRAPCQSIADVVRTNGYRTGLFHSGRFMYLGMDAVIRNRGFDALLDAGDIGGQHNSSFGVDEPSTVEKILEWIDRTPRNQPFFLAYLPIAGHHPYETPEAGRFGDREEINRYRNALNYSDAALGALREGLRTRGLDDRTLWVVFGDHGEAFGQHDGNYGHTFFLYEENVHVPFVIAAPGAFTDSMRSRQIVSLIDTAPTMLDLLGLPAPAGYQGRSMLDGEPRPARFFTDYSLGFLGLRDGPLKVIHQIESGRTAVFDLESDREERVDRAAQYAERVPQYERELRRWASAQRGRLLGSF